MQLLVQHCTWTTESQQREHYKDKLRYWGLFQIGFGLTSLAIGITTVPGSYDDVTTATTMTMDISTVADLYDNTTAATSPLSYSSPGTWAGVAICISGVHGLLTNRQPIMSIYRRDLCISVLSTVLGGVGSILTIMVLITTKGAPVGTHGAIFIALLIGGTVSSIVHLAYSGAGGCARNDGTNCTSRVEEGIDGIVWLRPSQYTVSQAAETIRVSTNSTPLQHVSHSNSIPHNAANPGTTRSPVRTDFTHEVDPPAYSDCLDFPPPYQSLYK